MAHRVFRASDGRDWQVWNVVPGAWRQNGWNGLEARRVERRSPDPVLAYTGPERRKADRRTEGCVVAPDLAAGWLTFECDAERRRLTPIPRGWADLADEELDRLREAAVPAPSRKLV